MKSWWITMLALGTLLRGIASPDPGTNPFEGEPVPRPATQVDALVSQRLGKLGIEPAAVCPDAVFARRVYLDVIGTLPTASEAREFILDPKPDKRRRLIDRLLERKEYADYWAMKWSDLLRVKAEFPINLWPNAAQVYHGWIQKAVKENMPYDQFARELLTSNGSNFRVAPVNFYRAMQNRTPEGIAQTVALTFMGTRTERWPTDRLAGLAAFFSQVSYKGTGEWKEEIVFFNPDQATNSLATSLTFPDGSPAHLAPGQDPRQLFADWLVDSRNPWFARNLANRVWSWLLGRGIVHEPDDLRADNAPSNPELLAFLEKELVASHYDLKALFRLVLNSRTYQSSSIPRSTDPAAAANFACYPLRRLEAEVLIDALNQITGSKERYSSSIPEPFTFIPDNLRAIALPDGSITSSFLQLFGRPSRDTGLEAERNNEITAAQALWLVNSSGMQKKLESGRLTDPRGPGDGTPADRVTSLYLRILSRFPTPAELETAQAYAQSGMGERQAAVDLAWALVNTKEFTYRH